MEIRPLKKKKQPKFGKLLRGTFYFLKLSGGKDLDFFISYDIPPQKYASICFDLEYNIDLSAFFQILLPVRGSENDENL